MGFGSRDEEEGVSEPRDEEEGEETEGEEERLPKGLRESGVSDEFWRLERECWLLNGLVMVLAG